MATEKNARIARSYIPFSNQITVNILKMSAQDIDDWRVAIDAARNPINPRRRRLYTMYDILKLDGHTDAVMDKRIIAITNKEVCFYEEGKEGEDNENIENIITKTPWFNDLLRHAMEQVGFGHSLIELVPEKGFIAKAELINRANVIPEAGFALYNYYNQPGAIYAGNSSAPNMKLDPKTGVYFREDPRYSNYMIEVGGRKDYGKLMIAAQYIIYKRGGFGDWAQFAELFGMPFRTAEYDPYDDAARRKLEEALSTAGGAGHLVMPRGSSLKFYDNNGTGKSEVFKDLVEICNSEISKIFLGQTMTTDQGSSRSQGEVHQDVEEQINLSDMIRLEYLLNWQLKPKLINLGYPVAAGKFQFVKTKQLPLDKRILIDMQVAQEVPIDEQYWYETYGVTKPDGDEIPVKIKPDNGDIPVPAPKPAKVQKKKSRPNNSLTLQINGLYGTLANIACPDCFPKSEADKFTKGPDKIMNRIAKGIHEGKIKRGSVDPALYKWIGDNLFEGVLSGMDDENAEPDEELRNHLEKNVYVFSAFKAYHEMREATDLLTDEDGNIRPFSDFKADVLAMNEKYNIAWLNTEYDLAVAGSQMASTWVDIQKNKKDLPMLQYTTAGDSRVRPAHADLQGIIKPVDDAFWNTFYPPNGWRCRCTVRSLADGEETDTSKAPLPELPPMFATNTAKEQVIFPENHPYFTVEKADQKQADKLWGLDIPGQSDE